ncbi:Cupredoxin [Halomonas chromatireducens]|uniref:Methylamine utilization protein n=1 Tax=Halomonas chromatireducens TaxID=507626 RepID=A0A109ULF3_9GAMM|nr:Cupredoxin [Halomonas chromatireducens]AMD00439.1 hypothetical protein LOKO_01371 [Halomonas chromatireducens]
MTHPCGILARAAWLFLCLGLLAPAAQATRIVIIDANSGDPLENAVVEIQTGTAEPTQSAEVMQRDAAFHPHVSVIPTDSAVSFPNRDTTRHHVYSFSPAKVFDLELYLQETPPPVHFDRTGVVVLGCNIHDQMQAFIVVSDALHVAVTADDGVAEFDGLPTGSHDVRVWHPQLSDTHQHWWEGSVEVGQSLTVSLSLEGTPPPPETLSPLQQRFRDAAQQHAEQN